MLDKKQIQDNWNMLLLLIGAEVKSDRKKPLKDFYEKFEDRLKIMPASSKISFHSCFEGGYIHHILNVINCGLGMSRLWETMGTNINYSREELFFSLLNHDLGKMGTEEESFYIINDSVWHVKNQGALYKINENCPFAAVPDRTLYLLQAHGITYTYNEMLAIKTHDGLYSEGNKEYLMGYNKPITSLVYIVHAADMMASRIEFEKQVLFKDKIEIPSFGKRLSKKELKDKIIEEAIDYDKIEKTLKNFR